jgi:glycosyltransferase involved in cell wall biosynthesis
MKIAFCHYYSLSFGGGGERFLVDAAKWLIKRGHSVSVYSVPLRRGRWRPRLDGVSYRERPLHFLDDDVAYYMYSPFVINFFRYNGPKVAGIHSSLLTRGLAETGYVTGNFVNDIRRHSVLVALMKRYGRIFQRRELANFDAVHWISPMKPVDLHHNNVFQIPNWVDTKSFSRREKDEEFTVLFVGRHEYGKGFDRFVELSEIFKDLKFVCTGESIGRIRGFGFLSTELLVKLYARSSVLVYPTRGDVFSLAILESLACGTPVITTPIPAHTQLGLPILYGDTVDSLAKALRTIHTRWRDDPQEYYRLADAGIAAIKRYDIDSILPKFEAMLISQITR